MENMETGSITGYIDVAQLVLYAFWLFFAVLILYLHREGKREGYPLQSERSAHIDVVGFPKPAPPKSFLMRDGSVVTVPRNQPEREIKAKPLGPWPGAPLVPDGDALADGVGPASYALREEHPDLTLDDRPKIVPLRVATEIALCDKDPNPLGLAAVGADGVQAGTVSDVWVDRSDNLLRYFEIEAGDDTASRKVLVPYNFAHIDTRRKQLHVKSVLGEQLARGPGPANPDQVTLREEDWISAYYAGGLLFATPDRAEPLL
jgi:photosynthetic reaction center H subunit